MAPAGAELPAGAAAPRPLYVASPAFLTARRIRRILTLAGLPPRVGLPGPGDPVAVWGQRPSAGRGRRLALWRGARLVHVEDAFLRSVRPGRMGDPPIGLLIDPDGVHYDPAGPSRIERILSSAPLDDPALIRRAAAAIRRLKRAELSKYNMHDPDLPVPGSDFVLVIDQTLGDASVTASAATPATFAAMLAEAEAEHPDARILIRTHPETRAGLRPGHFPAAVARGRIAFLAAPVAPWALLARARAVYTVSSQLGFEAILAGHRPRVFGQPFYAGWGLTDDIAPPPRRGRRLTAEQLFAAAMILAPVWYDPCRDRLCSLEEAIDQLEAEVRAWREDHRGHVAAGMRLWKRGPLQGFFGRWRPLVFDDRDPVRRAARTGRGLLAWAPAATRLAAPAAAAGLRLARVEDGFLRSRGLGAALVPPLSLVTDDLGIYYDPRSESRLERMIAEAATLDPADLERAEALADRIRTSALSKYNLGTRKLPPLPEGFRVLVPGQVEDDASILVACPAERSNRDLLRRARALHPGAVLIYKPHPDVEAGLRPGAIPEAELARLADTVVRGADPAALIEACDAVVTLTSLLGFEALIRGKPVACLGLPFYAGWGLTRDLLPAPDRRRARPSLAALVHATLIAYPRYRDPVSGLPCPPEVIAERLAKGQTGRGRPGLRLLAKVQGALASQAWLWRR